VFSQRLMESLDMPGTMATFLGGINADKKNKRPFGTPLAAPLQRTWCWQGGAGWGRGALQECLGG